MPEPKRLADVVQMIGERPLAEILGRTPIEIAFPKIETLERAEAPFERYKAPETLGEFVKELGTPGKAYPYAEEAYTFVKRMTETYPLTKEQAKALFELWGTQYKKTIEKGWGPFKKKKTVRIRPAPKAIETYLPEALRISPEIARMTAGIIREKISPIVEEAERRLVTYRPERRYERPVWLREYRGVLAPEAAEERLAEYNRMIESAAANLDKFVTALTSEETAKAAVLDYMRGYYDDFMKGLTRIATPGIIPKESVKAFYDNFATALRENEALWNEARKIFSSLIKTERDFYRDILEELRTRLG